jgi:hypothetical protein
MIYGAGANHCLNGIQSVSVCLMFVCDYIETFAEEVSQLIPFRLLNHPQSSSEGGVYVERDSMEPRKGVFLRFKIHGHASNTHLVLLYVRCRSDSAWLMTMGRQCTAPVLLETFVSSLSYHGGEGLMTR